MPTPDEKGRRLALIVASYNYSDPTLGQLRAPGHDASDLAEVLGDPTIGTFDVSSLINTPCDRLQRGIAQFCQQSGPGDLALMYLSCHGILDSRGRLYYATVDTERELLQATAISAHWLNEQLEDCRARRQILLLDCCHSGAFAGGRKGGESLALKDRFSGRGKIVLTASGATEYSFEGANVIGQGVRSVFTRAIVDGLRTGEADHDKDGLITITDLYHHVYDTVTATERRQTPELWAFGTEGDLLVARSPRGRVIEPLPLPDDLILILENGRLAFRESGVRELAALLDHGEPGLALTARLTLQRISDEEHPRIAAMAQAALGASPGQAVRRIEAQARARWEAEALAQREAEAEALTKREAEAEIQAQRVAEALAQAQREKDVLAKARREEENQAKARRQAQARVQREAEAAAQAERETEARALQEAAAHAKREAEVQAWHDEADNGHGQDAPEPGTPREHRWSRYRILAPAGATLIVVALALILSNLGTSHSPGTGSRHGASSSSVPGVYGAVPQAAGGKEYAGTITVAEQSGQPPSWILPIVSSENDTQENTSLFDYLMYRPLYWFVNGARPEENKQLSLAFDPVSSNDDKTFTIQLNPRYRWSDGKPVTSKDVLFWFDETKAAIAENALNWGDYMPGTGIPDEVADVETPDASTVVFTMKSTVNPEWFLQNELSTIQPMPASEWAKATASGPILDFTNPANAKRIYSFLAAQSKSETTWDTNPLWQVVDGPYRLSAFSKGAFTMVPNPKYGGPEAKAVSSYSGVPFSTDGAEYSAVATGGPDVGFVPITDVSQVSHVESDHGYLAYGEPSFGFGFALYNFKDTTGRFNKIIGQLYVRQALAHLQNQPYVIAHAYDGAAVPVYGPIPSAPVSPYAPADATTNPYPFSVAAAVSLLSAHGWTVTPGGTDTCSTPSRCGTGVPSGTKLAFTMVYSDDPAIAPQATNFAKNARQAGIDITLKSSNFSYMIGNYDDVIGLNDNSWAMEDLGSYLDSTYPTTYSIFNCSGGSDFGGYCDPLADTLITDSMSSTNDSAITAEDQYLTTEQPALFQPVPVSALDSNAVLVWKKTISGPPWALESITQAYINPEEMYFTTPQSS